MDETAQTALVAELALSDSLVKLAVNLTLQIIIAEGGNMTKARQLVVNLEGGGELGPGIPKVTPAVATGYDAVSALVLANDKARKTAQFIVEQAALVAIRKGIKLTR